MSHLLGQCKSWYTHTENYYYTVSSSSVPTCCSGHQRTSGLLRAHKCALRRYSFKRRRRSRMSLYFAVSHASQDEKIKSHHWLLNFFGRNIIKRGNVIFLTCNTIDITEHTWKTTTEAWIEMEMTLDRVLYLKDTTQGKVFTKYLEWNSLYRENYIISKLDNHLIICNVKGFSKYSN